MDIRGEAAKKFAALETARRQALLQQIGALGDRALSEGLEAFGPPYRLWAEHQGLVLLLELDTRRRVLRVAEVLTRPTAPR